MWELLLKDDGYGIDNISFATSKQKNKWFITIVYYETLESKKCPPNYFEKRQVGFQACLDKYNFYQRRWHDYDYTKGEVRKQGDGETNADKPWPEDLPGDNDNMPKKKPLKPLPIIPKSKEDDDKVDQKPKKPQPKKTNCTTKKTNHTKKSKGSTNSTKDRAKETRATKKREKKSFFDSRTNKKKK